MSRTPSLKEVDRGATAVITEVAEDQCPECLQFLRVGDWPFCPHGRTPRGHHSIHIRERAVVYQHPATGKVVYPGRNDVPMPERYRARGFERRELDSLRSIESFEKEQGVLNEKAHYDAGTGNSADSADPPDLPVEVKSLVRSGAIKGGAVKGD